MFFCFNVAIIDQTQGGSGADHRHKPYGAGHRHKHVWAGYGIYGRMSVSSGFVRLASVRLSAGMISNLLEMVAFCPPGETHRLHGRRDARRYEFRRFPSGNVG